jgi:hypothetical protein
VWQEFESAPLDGATAEAYRELHRPGRRWLPVEQAVDELCQTAHGGATVIAELRQALPPSSDLHVLLDQVQSTHDYEQPSTILGSSLASAMHAESEAPLGGFAPSVDQSVLSASEDSFGLAGASAELVPLVPYAAEGSVDARPSTVGMDYTKSNSVHTHGEIKLTLALRQMLREMMSEASVLAETSPPRPRPRPGSERDGSQPRSRRHRARTPVTPATQSFQVEQAWSYAAPPLEEMTFGLPSWVLPPEPLPYEVVAERAEHVDPPVEIQRAEPAERPRSRPPSQPPIGINLPSFEQPETSMSTGPTSERSMVSWGSEMMAKDVAQVQHKRKSPDKRQPSESKPTEAQPAVGRPKKGIASAGRAGRTPPDGNAPDADVMSVGSQHSYSLDDAVRSAMQAVSQSQSVLPPPRFEPGTREEATVVSGMTMPQTSSFYSLPEEHEGKTQQAGFWHMDSAPDTSAPAALALGAKEEEGGVEDGASQQLSPKPMVPPLRMGASPLQSPHLSPPVPVSKPQPAPAVVRPPVIKIKALKPAAISPVEQQVADSTAPAEQARAEVASPPKPRLLSPESPKAAFIPTATSPALPQERQNEEQPYMLPEKSLTGTVSQLASPMSATSQASSGGASIRSGGGGGATQDKHSSKHVSI